MPKRIIKRPWVLTTTKNKPTPIYFLNFGQFGAIGISSMLKAKRFKTRAGAENALTHDMKHQGYIAQQISVWESK